MKSLLDGNLHITLMSLPCVGILVFNIVPLVYMISMAFTSYSKEDEHLQLFDWNGLTQFKRVLNFSGNMGKQFWHVLAWTVVWALVATFLNYITGMILAMIINRKETKAKGFWRFCLYYLLQYHSLFLDDYEHHVTTIRRNQRITTE